MTAAHDPESRSPSLEASTRSETPGRLAVVAGAAHLVWDPGAFTASEGVEALHRSENLPFSRDRSWSFRSGASRAGEVLRRLLADLDQLRAGDDGLRDDFVRARRAALAAALADPSIPSATAWRLQRAVTSHAGLARESLAAAIASTTLRDVVRVIAEDLQPARMVGVLSGRSADTAAAMATAGITGALSISDPPAKR